MKRYGYLYEKIYNYDNIQYALQNAQKGKKHYKEVNKINMNQEFYIRQIQKMLYYKTYKTAKYKKIIKHADNGKIREIYKLPYYPDRIVHHCIMQIIEPIWFKSLIRDTYAAIKNRGIHDGVRRIKKALRDKENTIYCLKMDIKKFYFSINNQILKRIIRKKIKDPDLIWLLDEIIDSADGIPIGNYLSQYFGNLYLSEYDHWIKEELKMKYYFRYCDDIVILHKDKNILHEIRKESNDYFKYKLKLEINNNWQVFPVDKRGIDFLGYRFFHNYILLRKSISQKFKNKIKYIKKNWEILKPSKVINRIMSYWGWLKYANCKNLVNTYIDNEIFWIMKQKCKEANCSNPLQGII